MCTYLRVCAAECARAMLQQQVAQSVAEKEARQGQPGQVNPVDQGPDFQPHSLPNVPPHF